jgi:hypothetical protein
MTQPCCSRLQRGASPFIVLALGWHDGPTTGLARCADCGQTYHFEMLDWDDEQSTRVYAFAKIERDAYARLIAMHDEIVTDGVAKANRMALATRDALAGTFGRSLYVIADDLGREIIACRELDFAGWKKLMDES